VEAVLILHAGVTCFLCGLAWTVQGVHYPLFALVDPASFPDYERSHQIRMGRAVAPPMLLELALAMVLPWIPGVPVGLAWSGLALVLAIWLRTWRVAVPCHRRLAHGFEPAVHRRLIRADRVRTFLWTGRAVLGLLLLV